jgi:single-stranded-DNA-specific exonuclease
MHEAALAGVEARTLDAADTDSYTLCLYDGSGTRVVVGIVAGRLRSLPSARRRLRAGYRRRGRARAGRSPASPARWLDVVAKRLPGVVAKFGGHAYAAGVTLAERDLPRFAQAFEALARECLSPAQLERILESDGPLAEAELSGELATVLAREV